MKKKKDKLSQTPQGSLKQDVFNTEVYFATPIYVEAL